MRRAAAALLCLLLLCACAAPEQADALPQELAGSWVSAGNGDLIETMTLAQDGTISVQCTFRGKDTGTIRGVWHADGQTLFTDIQEGTAPYQAEFIWTVDGRELTLTITFDEKPHDTTVETTPQEDSSMPSEGDYGDWYEYFRRFFGG